MNRIKTIAESKGWDWGIFRKKVFAYCSQNGIDCISDTGLRNWWEGKRMWGESLLLIAKVLQVEPNEIYSGAGEPAKERMGK